MRGVLKAVVLLAIGMSVLSGPGLADTLRIYAAGSLSAAFQEMVRAFPAPPDAVAPPFFGPSGVLRGKIEAGDAVDVLASADMAQPRRLAHPGQPVIMFTRNRLCALGRTTLGLTEDTLLARMLDPAVRLATSTPGADPGGDYAWAMFARAEAVHPGAQAILQSKA
jgi:molybdate transport system substrate-binding protein